MTAGIIEVPAVRRNRRLFDEKGGLQEMSHLLRSTACGADADMFYISGECSKKCGFR